MRLLDHGAISPDELASLQRVFDQLCPAFDKRDPPEAVGSIACTLIMLFQNGLKDEAMLLAEMEKRGHFLEVRRSA
jgi:hypothetical protein